MLKLFVAVVTEWLNPRLHGTDGRPKPVKIILYCLVIEDSFRFFALMKMGA
jgi:hypothetical protein